MNKFPDFLESSADEVAKKLLGCELERQLDGDTIRVRIVETEAYDQDDEASHAFGGKRKRNATMFGPAGNLYVYFTYGMHYCCNIVAGHEGYGAGALIRAVEPVAGVEIIERNRSMTGFSATNGPAKLTQALGIDLLMNGHDLRQKPLRLFAGVLRREEVIDSSPRVGISKATSRQRRYFIKDNPYVSNVPKKMNWLI